MRFRVQRQCVVLVAAPLALCLAVTQSPAQLRVRRAPVDPNASRYRPEEALPGRGLINPGAPIVNLFARASEGVQRADWKLAIDSLQRIIDSQESSLLPMPRAERGGVVRYESAQRQALHMLAQLPSEGLAAYRLMYDGQAQHLLQRGVDKDDLQALRAVVERFFMTQHGVTAADELSSRLLDLGAFTEALDAIDLVFALTPPSGELALRLTGKRAIATAMLGRFDDARRLARLLRQTDGQAAPDTAVADSVDRLIEQAAGTASSDDFAREMAVEPGAAANSFARRSFPSVDPTLVDPLPWRYAFSMDDADNPYTYPMHDADSAHGFSPWTVITNAESVFVRHAGGVSALRAEDLQVIWATTGERDLYASNGPMSWASVGRDLNAWIRPPDDALFGAISASHGLVFAIDRGGTGARRESQDLLRAQRLNMMRFDPDAGEGLYLSNRLVAFDATTGELVWSRGRSDTPGDELGTVEFRSVPLTVGDRLWVPYFRQRDYFVGVLDPTSGTLQDEILLCTMDTGSYARRPAQPPSYAYGKVFVPSGHGLLFAVDAATRVLRWANAYAASDDDDDQADPGSEIEWASTAPLTTAGTVILCPTDYPKTLAFSAMDGRLLWTLAPQGAWYPIAGHGSRLWLGGTKVVSVNVATGRVLWSVPLHMHPTGRGVLSGGHLLLPSTGGLLTLSADTGEQVDVQPPLPSQPPLGNLLCTRDGLFSIDESGVRRYPDIPKSYVRVQRRVAANPADESAVREKVWLDVFRDRPDEALAVLDTMIAATQRTPSKLQGQTIQAWVAALLAAAMDRETTAPQDALALYERATELARAPGDQLRCAIALADQLMRTGESAGAWRLLWQTALSANADLPMPVSPGVRGSLRLAIAGKLREIAAGLGEDDLSAVRKLARDRIRNSEQALQSSEHVTEAIRLLRAVSELDVVEGQRARLALGKFRLSQDRFEQAEQWLLTAIPEDGDREASIIALMTLCKLYLSSPFDLDAMATPWLDDLVRLYGTNEIPTAYKEKVEQQAVTAGTVAEWVAAVSEKLQQPADTAANVTPDARTLELTGQVLWNISRHEDLLRGRLVEFDTPNGRTVPDRLLFVDVFGRGVCVDAEAETLQWHTRLRLPGRFDETLAEAELDPDVSRRAVASGQTAVIAGQTGFFAVGLASGKRIWTKPFDGTVDEYDPWYVDMRMAVDHGSVAVLDRADRLSLLRLADGRTIWARDMREESLAYVWIVNDVVLTSDRRFERFHLIARTDGSLVQRVLFRQPDPEDVLVRPALTAGILCGPESTAKSDSIRAVDAATGELAWEKQLDKPLVQLFIPQEGYVGIGMLRGDVQILDARTGELILDRHVPGARAVEYASLLDGLLIAQQANTVMAGRKRRPALVAIDLATGETAWVRNDLASVGGFNGMLYILDGVIPAVIEYPGDGLSRFKAKGLAMIDARTGRNIGPDVELVSSNSRTLILNDLQVLPDRIVVGTEEGYLALETTGNKRPGAENN